MIPSRVSLAASLVTLAIAGALTMNMWSTYQKDKNRLEVAEKQLALSEQLLVEFRVLMKMTRAASDDAQEAAENTAATRRVLTTEVQPRMEALAKKKQNIVVKTPAPLVIRQEVYPAKLFPRSAPASRGLGK